MPAPSLLDIRICAATGVRAEDMTLFDVLRARQMSGGSIPESTIVGVPPISFAADGTPLTAWSVLGNMDLDSTPTPDNAVTPPGCGDLIEAGAHAGEYAIAFAVGSTTQAAYLPAPLGALDGFADEASSTGTVTRRIKKITFDGTEAGWTLFSGNGAHQFYIGNALTAAPAVSGSSAVSNIAPYGATTATRAAFPYGCYPISSGQGIAFQVYGAAADFPDVAAWQAYLAEMSANGTPVCAWYILAESQEESFEAPTLTPTAGSNTLSVDTALQPLSVSITGHIAQA